jgi:hypothetical protein
MAKGSGAESHILRRGYKMPFEKRVRRGRKKEEKEERGSGGGQEDIRKDVLFWRGELLSHGHAEAQVRNVIDNVAEIILFDLGT